MPADSDLARSARAFLLKGIESTQVVNDVVIPRPDALISAKADAAAKAKLEAIAQANAETEKITLLQIQARALALIQAQADAQAQQLRQAEAVAASAAEERAKAEKKAHEEEVALAKNKLKELAQFTSQMQTIADQAAQDYTKAQSDLQSILLPEDFVQPSAPMVQPAFQPVAQPVEKTVKRRSFFSLCFWSSQSKAKIPSETEARITRLEDALAEIKEEVTAKVDQSLMIIDNKVDTRLEALNNTMMSLITLVQANQPPNAATGKNVSQKGNHSTKANASVVDHIPNSIAAGSA